MLRVSWAALSLSSPRHFTSDSDLHKFCSSTVKMLLLYFPEKSVVDCPATGRRSSRKWRTKTPSHIVRPIVHEDIDVEDFPDQMEYFAKDIATFLNCLNEFPEFTDEAVNTSILSFERDLQVS